jgi:hypothetical protein
MVDGCTLDAESLFQKTQFPAGTEPGRYRFETGAES